MEACSSGHRRQSSKTFKCTTAATASTASVNAIRSSLLTLLRVSTNLSVYVDENRTIRRRLRQVSSLAQMCVFWKRMDKVSIFQEFLSIKQHS